MGSPHTWKCLLLPFRLQPHGKGRYPLSFKAKRTTTNLIVLLDSVILDPPKGCEVDPGNWTGG